MPANPSTPERGPIGARRYTALDRVIAAADQAARAVLVPAHSTRPYPAERVPETLADPAARTQVARLMRVNHSGEIAAQALYHGQSFTARSAATAESLREAGREETDHLAWCAQRIEELGGRPSLLNPVWYAGSFIIGALAGFAGDRSSLGFVAETERQVVEHLGAHLKQLPHEDSRTRAILEQMSADEARHGHDAMSAGGAPLPSPARAAMKVVSRVMTLTAYRI